MMNWMKGLRVAALGCLMGMSACAAGVNSTDISSARAFSVDRAGALKGINAFRAENGLPPVVFNAVLDKAAERQARAMAARDKMGHEVDGKLPGRVSSFGYQWVAVSENLGWAYPSVPAVIHGWENSAAHRRNLLSPNVSEIGFAAAKGPGGQPYWALILGRQLPANLRGVKLVQHTVH